MSDNLDAVKVVGDGGSAYLDMGSGEYLHFYPDNRSSVYPDYRFRIHLSPNIAYKKEVCRTSPYVGGILTVMEHYIKHNNTIDWDNATSQVISMFCIEALARVKRGRIILKNKPEVVDEFLNEVCHEYKIKSPISIKSFIDKIEIRKYETVPNFDELIGDGFCYTGEYWIFIIRKNDFLLITETKGTFTEYLYPIPEWLKYALKNSEIYKQHGSLKDSISEISKSLASIAGAYPVPQYEFDATRPDEIKGKYKLENYFFFEFYDWWVIWDFYHEKAAPSWRDGNSENPLLKAAKASKV